MKEFNKIVSSCYRNSPNVFKARFNKEVLKRTKWKDESEKMQYLRTKKCIRWSEKEENMQTSESKDVSKQKLPELKPKEEKSNEEQHQLRELLKYKAA